jgi:hypothetical protein
LDESAVSDLSSGGELLVEPMLLSGREDADRVALALASLGAGRELEPA